MGLSVSIITTQLCWCSTKQPQIIWKQVSVKKLIYEHWQMNFIKLPCVITYSSFEFFKVFFKNENHSLPVGQIKKLGSWPGLATGYSWLTPAIEENNLLWKFVLQALGAYRSTHPDSQIRASFQISGTKWMRADPSYRLECSVWALVVFQVPVSCTENTVLPLIISEEHLETWLVEGTLQMGSNGFYFSFLSPQI